MLQNAYLLAKIGVDTAENGRFNFANLGSLQGFNFYRPPAPRSATRPATHALRRTRFKSAACFASTSRRTADASPQRAERRGFTRLSARSRLSEARSRLYQHRFLQLNSHFSAFFKIYKICKLLYRSDLKILQNFVKNFVILKKSSQI